MNDYLGQNQFFFEADIFADQICFFYERYLTSFTFTWIRGFQNLLGFLIFHSLQSKTFDFSKENGTCLNKKKLLKGVHPIIFVLNIFPNLHLIQKYIHNQQLFWNSCWLCINFWIKWEFGKIFDTKMIGWTLFSRYCKLIRFWFFLRDATFMLVSSVIRF